MMPRTASTRQSEGVQKTPLKTATKITEFSAFQTGQFLFRNYLFDARYVALNDTPEKFTKGESSDSYI